MDLVQQDAFRRTFREGLFQDAFLAGTLDEISDFKIVFKFKWLFGHKGRLPITGSSIPQDIFFSSRGILGQAWMPDQVRHDRLKRNGFLNCGH